MINKVKIVLTHNEECFPDKAVDIQYPMSFEYKGEVRMVDSSGRYHKLNRYEADNHEKMQARFSKTEMSITYEFEDNEKEPTFTKEDKNTKDIVENFWKHNPICLVNGKPNNNAKSGSNFNLIDTNVRVANATTLFKDRLKANTFIAGMNHEERSDIAYYFNRTVVGLTEEELLLDLVGENGFLLREENLSNFLRIFVDGKSEDKDMIIVLRKAIAFQIIDNKIDDGRNNYYLNDTFLGSDENGLVDWSRKHPREFEEFIKRKVKEQEEKESKVIRSIEKGNVGRVDIPAFNKLKEEAKDLVDEGFIGKTSNYWNMSFDKLSELVKEAKKKKEEIKIA